VWLDDLDRYLNAGVDAGLLGRLLSVNGVQIIATMRASAYETFKPGRLRSAGTDVIDLAHREHFTEWDQKDRDQASSFLARQPGQADVVAALQHGMGLGDYLSAVPDLIEQLEQGTPPPHGVAVVRAVADWYRSGLARPAPVSWVRNLYPVYLPDDDVTLLTRFDDGVAWAASPVSGARLVTQPTDGRGLVIHDAVLEHLSSTLPPGLPEAAWRAITDELTTHQSFEELTIVGITAYRVHADSATAERILQMAAEAGHADAAYNLGFLLQQSGQSQEAERCYRVAAEAGHADAANSLGLLLQQSGWAEEAERWYRAASKAGHADAAYNLGLLLEESGWVKGRDRSAEALTCFEQAASNGHVEAAYAAGRIHEAHGNADQARSNYQIAATKDHCDAAYRLGMLLHETDLEQALAWLDKADDAGHPEVGNVARLLRAPSDFSPGYLDEVAKELGKAVHEQWSRNLERISEPYPLKVRFSPVMTAAVEPPDAYRAGVFEDIATVFTNGRHERMVILGKPGSGKSMIAQYLTVRLLDSHPEREMVPVLLSLARWDPEDPLEEWVAAEMAQTYPSLSRRGRVSGSTERTLAYHLIAGKCVLMVLDGLDEVGIGKYALGKAAMDKQCAALRRLSEFAESGQHFVVTCRTEDYDRIVDQARAPLPKTPAIALRSLAMDDVIDYLKATPLLVGPSARRWDRFLDYLQTEPDGPLTVAMSRPLGVWLVRTNYREPETQPDELFRWGSANEIIDFLLGGLVDAAYSDPVVIWKKNNNRKKNYDALTPEGRKIQQARLVYFADYLSKQIRKAGDKTAVDNNIEWWYLPRAVPRWFTGGTIGLISGCLLGASGGLAVAIKFGHSVGLVVGILLGIVVAVHTGTTSVRWQDVPRAVHFNAKMTFPRFAHCLAVASGVAVCFGFAAERGGGIVFGLVTAVVVGPLCAMAIRPTFGTAPAVATGISASIALGLGASLFGHRPAPLIAAGAVGLTFLVSTWVFIGIFQNANPMKAVSPESLLRGDRDGSFIVALTAGFAFAVVFGLALGPLVGLLAFVGITVTAAFTVSIWGAFTLTRIWLAMFRGMPLDIMGFLREADSRGVLRREGGAFQFRYLELQRRLSDSAIQPIEAPVLQSRTDTERDGQRR
jgi:tetratricopeptide (TPR) repeat protein